MKDLDKITLTDGRNIFLEKLHQFHTYAGLMEGYPDKELNKIFIEDALEEAKRIFTFGPAYLIEPLENKKIDSKRIEFEDTGELLDEPYTKEIEYWELPGITCIGEFISSPREKKDDHFSFMTIMWHQNEFALPIENDIVKKIQIINWDKNADGGWW